jgi:hypothetical protein
VSKALGKSAKRLKLRQNLRFRGKAMDFNVMVWLFFRALRWACWGAFLLVSGLYMSNPAAHLNGFGHLTPQMEMLMFGTSLAAVMVGLIELAMRDRAGLTQPKFTQLIPPKAEGRAALVR